KRIDEHATELAACEAKNCPPPAGGGAAAGPGAGPAKPEDFRWYGPERPPAETSGAGIGTYNSKFVLQPKAKIDYRHGMSAEDLYTLLDRSLGNRFNSLVIVIGGCFSADFTNQAETSGVGKSGKPVAVLSATDRC